MAALPSYNKSGPCKSITHDDRGAPTVDSGGFDHVLSIQTDGRVGGSTMLLRHKLLLFLACVIAAPVPCSGGEPSAKPERPGVISRLGDVRFWWTNCYISSLAFSADSKTLAVAANRYQYEPIEEPAVRLLEIPSGVERRLKKLPSAMNCAAFSPDGKSLACIHSNPPDYYSRLSVWDLAEGTRRPGFDVGGHPSLAVFYSPDGRCLALAQYNAVLLLDSATGRELRRLEGHEIEVTGLAFSPDSKLLASSSSAKDSQGGWYTGGAVRLWDFAAGKLLRKIAFDSKTPIKLLQFTSDGKILAAWKNYADISLYDVATGREIRKIAGKFSAAAFSADGKLLATGGPEIHLWELPSGRELRAFPGCADMRLLTFSPDGKTLAAVREDRSSGNRGGRVLLWDVAKGEEIVPYVGHRGAVQSLSCTADGRTVVSAGSDGTIRLWDVATGKQQRVLEDRDADFQCVAVSPDGKTLAARDAAGNVTFWASTAKKLGHFSLNEIRGKVLQWSGPKPILAFTSGGRMVISGRQVWKENLTKIARTVRADKDEGIPIALSADGSHFATLPAAGLGMHSNPTYISRVRRLESGKEVFRIKGEMADCFWAAAFSPDGKTLAVSQSKLAQMQAHLYQHRLIFWEVASGKQLLKIDLQNRAHALAFSPDGKQLATASGLYYRPENDRTIRIWDVATGKQLEELRGHGGLVNALLFSPDGRRLFSGSSDGTILIWDTRWPHLRPQQTRGDLSPEQLRAAWEALAGADAAKAFRSLGDLAAAPRCAVPFLRENLPTPPPLDRQLIARLIADLDSGDFAAREKARMELEKRNELAEDALRKTLQNRPSLEMRRRIEALLERLHRFPAPVEQLRISRAMLALEWMNTVESRRLIETLAQGTPGARLTREAKAAHQRLSRLSPGKP